MASRAIWKYTLSITDLQLIDLPVGAQILTVQNQQDMLTLWAMVDPNVPRETRTLAVYGTGNPIPNDDPGAYIGTMQQKVGTSVLVWHVFEVGGLFEED